MAERKLNDPDVPLTTLHLFCRNTRTENETQTLPPSQQGLNTNITFFKDRCLRLQISSGEACYGGLGHSWSWCLHGHCWESHSHSWGSKGKHVPVLQLPLQPDILMQTLLINPPRPVKWDVAWGPRVISPSAAPAPGQWQLLGDQQSHVGWQYFKMLPKNTGHLQTSILQTMSWPKKAG